MFAGVKAWRGTPIVAIAAGYALVLVAVWWRVFLSHQICAWDCILEYWPDLRFQIDSVRHGSIPTWCPWSMGGYPFHADVQSGFYNPINWVCIVAGLVVNGNAWIIQLKVLLTMLAGLCGMHWLSYVRTRSHTAAVVAALTFVLGSPALVHKNGAFLWPLMYLPFAILAISAFFDRPSLRRAACVAIALWLCGSAGHPQGFFYDLVAIALYTSYRLIALGKTGLVALVRDHWLSLVVVGAVSLGLLLVVYLPAATAIPLSVRAERGLGYVLGDRLPARALGELFVPNLDTNWMWDVYVGPLALVGGLWALVGRTTARARVEVIPWLLLGWLGLDLAMGKDGHTLVFFYNHVPGFTLFRIAYRHKVIFGFAAAVLAGDGVAAAGGATAKQVRWLAGIGAAWIAISMGIAWRPLVLLQLAILVLALWRAWPRARRVASIALCICVFADLWHAGALKLSILQPYETTTPKASALAAVADTHEQWRYHVHDIALPVGGTLPYAAAYTHELREQSGYGNPIASQRSVDVNGHAVRTPGLLGHFGVKYELGGRLVPPGGTPIGHGVRGHINPDPAPLGRFYTAACRDTAPSILARLAETSPSALPCALVEADAPANLPGGTGEHVDAELVSYEPGRVRLRVHASAPGVLVVNEAWYPGWEATVDGASAAVFRANYLLIGVQLAAGDHDVVVSFAPASFHGLLLAFVIALGVAVTFSLARWPWLDIH